MMQKMARCSPNRIFGKPRGPVAECGRKLAGVAHDTLSEEVKSVSDGLIELHGCQGAVYPYYRPESAWSNIEWFR